MKWPSYIALVRHGESVFNKTRRDLKSDPLWEKFVAKFDKDMGSAVVKALAKTLLKKYDFPYSDYNTPIAKEGSVQAVSAGKHLKSLIDLPDVIITSPYLRCQQTLDGLVEGWAELGGVQKYTDELLTERSVGLRGLYLTDKIFYVFYPEQKKFFDIAGYYHNRFPQGEDVPDVRRRLRQFDDTLVREFTGKKVLLVAHHQTILSFRANQERMSPEQFMDLDKNNPPKNCSITIYRGDPNQGKDGRLLLETYNKTAP